MALLGATRERVLKSFIYVSFTVNSTHPTLDTACSPEKGQKNPKVENLANSEDMGWVTLGCVKCKIHVRLMMGKMEGDGNRGFWDWG